MEKFMRLALELAEEYRGFTSPNPMVGAIVVKDNRIIGKGAHCRAGEAHAEVVALQQAGKLAQDATLYVTLEPCNHFGKTPPCTDLIIASGISKVVCAMKDPNPLVCGSGFEKLRKAGIEVVENVLKKEAEQLNEIFIKNVTEKQPFVILKSAITLDGKIASPTNDSKWISNNKSRLEVHKIRNSVDGIIIGKNTFLIDNPRLNVRLDSPTSDPQKIIIVDSLDLKLETILNSNAYKLSSQKPLIICVTDNHSQHIESSDFINHNIILLKFEKNNLKELLQKLMKLGINSILLEGGAGIYTSFIKANLVDKIQLFVAPKIIGDQGISWLGNLPIDYMKDAIQLKDTSFETLDDNIMITSYQNKRN